MFFGIFLPGFGDRAINLGKILDTYKNFKYNYIKYHIIYPLWVGRFNTNGISFVKTPKHGFPSVNSVAYFEELKNRVKQRKPIIHITPKI